MLKKALNISLLIIKFRFFILLNSLIFILIFGIAFIIEFNHYRGTIDDTIASNRSTANIAAAIVIENQKAALRILDSFRIRPGLINAAKNKNQREALEFLKSMKLIAPEIDTVFITDKNGTDWVNFPIYEEIHGKNLSHRDWYKGIAREWKPYISGVYKRIVGEKDLAITVCAPIFDEKGNVVGILANVQRTFSLGNFIKKIQLVPDTKISLVDQSGQIIYSNRFDYEKEIVKYPGFDFIQRNFPEESNVEIQESSESNSRKYISYAPIKGIGWSVIVERKKTDLLKSEAGYFLLTGIISLLIFLVICLSFVYIRKEYVLKQMLELKQAHYEIIERERRYSSMLENISLIAVGLDADGNITYANPYLLQLTGYTREEITGKNWFNTFIPEKIRNVVNNEIFRELLQNNEMYTHYENPILTKTGEERIITWNNISLKDISGKTIGTMSIGEDVTELKKFQERLQEQYNLMQKIIDTIPTPVFFRNKEGKYLGCNKAYEKYSGLSRDEIMQKTFYDILSKDFLEKILPIDTELLSRPGIKTYELPTKYADGTLHDIIVNKATLLDLDGEPTGIVGIFVDITERKKMEKALRKAKEELEEKIKEATAKLEETNMKLARAYEELKELDRMKTEFFSNVSHELRSPLTAIRGGIDYLLRKPGIGDVSFLTIIKKNADHMIKMVNDLLDLSRIEAGKLGLYKSLEDISRIAAESIAIVQLIAQEKNIRIEAKLSPDSYAYVDSDRIKQVMLNLLSNSVKFTPEGGRITITVEENKNNVEVGVEDTGIGIPEKDLNKIFEKFYRILHASGGNATGSGLGLAISRGIIKAHHGKIRAESKEGGAKFIFVLPKGKSII